MVPGQWSHLLQKGTWTLTWVFFFPPTQAFGKKYCVEIKWRPESFSIPPFDMEFTLTNLLKRGLTAVIG
jgi:hypothetical protein